MIERSVAYQVDGQPFEGHLLYDDAQLALRPGLLMAPNWLGVSTGAIELARQVAGRGYVVFIADLYGLGVRPEGPVEASAAMLSVKGTPALRQRMSGALESLVVQPGIPLDNTRLAAFGFCFGGHCALELARSGAPLSATVSFHGTLDTHAPAEAGSIRGALLALDGADDPLVPREQLQGFIAEMSAAGVDWQLTSYGGTVHSFTDPNANVPGTAQYSPKIATRAFSAMYALLDEVFA